MIADYALFSGATFDHTLLNVIRNVKGEYTVCAGCTTRRASDTFPSIIQRIVLFVCLDTTLRVVG